MPLNMPRTALLAALLVAVASREAPGQGTTGLRGTVVAGDNGERLPYALVSLEPGSRGGFAAENGVFFFDGMAPGSYRLRVRQVGYRPFDSTIVVAPDAAPLVVALERVVVELRSVDVATSGRCSRPGPPDRAVNAALADIFEQLKLNAQRHQLLLDQYAHRATIERLLKHEFADGRFQTTYDTITSRSDERWRYRPGRITRPDPKHRDQVLYRDPSLADLADSVFHTTHCFTLAGVDTLQGGSWVRMDFTLAESMRYPDLEGSAYLDRNGYVVRHIRFRVTNPGMVSTAASITALISFAEVRPSLMLMDRFGAVSELRSVRRSEPVRLIEEQRRLRVEFLHQP